MKTIQLFMVGCLMLFMVTDTMYAIPAFARKYRTSCATCHNGYPNLTPFGEAFRRSGYQFPAGTDAEFTKEQPIPLGSEGSKRAFPDAIWPGTIPGSSPISFVFTGEMDYNPNEAPRFTFGDMGSEVEAIAAGTVGEDVSFWGHAIFSSEGLELNRIFMVFSNLIGNSYAFNARVGVFEPSLFSFSTHRGWLEGYWLTTRAFSEDMGWTIEEFQKGLEINGMLGGRWVYAAGVVEGFGSPHSGKDFYGHIGYKIGGMRVDGVTEGAPSPASSEPYIDDSFTLGAFAYEGNAMMGPDSMLQQDKFSMVGGDFNAFYGRCNLFGGLGIRHDDHPYLELPGKGANSTVWFTQFDLVIYPWLLPGIRYESWAGHMIDPNSGQPVAYTDSQFVPGIVFLIRPNVKATLRTSISKSESAGETKYSLGQVGLALTFGI